MPASSLASRPKNYSQPNYDRPLPIFFYKRHVDPVECYYFWMGGIKKIVVESTIITKELRHVNTVESET